MKTIVCYGDSNTWGLDRHNPNRRLTFDERWPGRMARQLGPDYHVVEQGQPSRTAVMDDPVDVWGADSCKSGRATLTACLRSQAPIDLLILMLGTNDLKNRFSFQPADIALGVATLIQITRLLAVGPRGADPRVLVIVPPVLPASMNSGGFYKAHDHSLRLAETFRQIVSPLGCELLDSMGALDGQVPDDLHLSLAEHAALARAAAERVREMFDVARKDVVAHP
ncbi:MAG: hypothetical protein IT442_15105 [Phycisphaeraceae bacterium]|nr:hypothetical protein [Phycisphaeraceae bacterium]